MATTTKQRGKTRTRITAKPRLRRRGRGKRRRRRGKRRRRRETGPRRRRRPKWPRRKIFAGGRNSRGLSWTERAESLRKQRNGGGKGTSRRRRHHRLPFHAQRVLLLQLVQLPAHAHPRRRLHPQDHLLALSKDRSAADPEIRPPPKGQFHPGTPLLIAVTLLRPLAKRSPRQRDGWRRDQKIKNRIVPRCSQSCRCGL